MDGWKDGLTTETVREHVGSALMVTDTNYLQMGPGMGRRHGAGSI